MEDIMRFSCNVAELNNALSIAIHAIPVKSPKLILEGILIEAQQNAVILTSTDMALGIECKIPAIVEMEGSVVLPGRFFCEVARKLPGEDVRISVNERSVASISSGFFKTSIAGMDALEFPELPVVKGTTVTMTEKQLRRMLNGTLFAVAIDESRPILTGCLFDVDGNDMSIVALDGYRLAICREKLENTFDASSHVIGGKVLGDVVKILNDQDDEVSICFSRSHVCIRIGENMVIARLLEGDYMRYKQILPTEYVTRIIVNRMSLADAMDRAMLIGRESKSTLVTFKVEGNQMTILMQNTSMEEKIEISSEGKDMEIAFNVKYVMDVLKAISDDEIEMRFKSNVSPCLIYPTDGGDQYLYLILPVRV